MLNRNNHRLFTWSDLKCVSMNNSELKCSRGIKFAFDGEKAMFRFVQAKFRMHFYSLNMKC